MVDLLQSREKIDQIDREIVRLFEERMVVANDVAEYKKQTGKKIFDKERELEKLATLREYATNEFNRHGIEELFTQIMSISRKYQYSLLASYKKEEVFVPYESLNVVADTKVAFFGEPGSYSEQAMLEYFGTEVDAIAVTNFKKVMELVSNGEVEYGVLPIENSSTGGITDIYDLLVDYNNTIIGEHVVKVEHALVALPGTKVEDLDVVYSHPQGILQCRPYFEDKPGIRLEKCESTSSGAKKVQEDKLTSQGAISSKRAAECYGLDILQEAINKEEANCTRFIIITNQQIYNKAATKVSICFEIPHESGSLYTMLSNIIFNNLNMTKIESRPISGRTWEYRFFIEFEGNLANPGVRNAINGIDQEASQLRILGNFVAV